MECAKGSRLFIDESVAKSILATFHSSDKLINAITTCIVSELLQQTPFCYLNKKAPGAQPTTPVPSGQIIGSVPSVARREILASLGLSLPPVSKFFHRRQ